MMEAGQGHPSVVSKEWAVAPCGCTAFVGIRLDTEEFCLPIVPCKEAHVHLCKTVEARMVAEIEDPLKAKWNVVETADRVLGDVFGALAS